MALTASHMRLGAEDAWASESVGAASCLGPGFPSLSSALRQCLPAEIMAWLGSIGSRGKVAREDVPIVNQTQRGRANCLTWREGQSLFFAQLLPSARLLAHTLSLVRHLELQDAARRRQAEQREREAKVFLQMDAPPPPV